MPGIFGRIENPLRKINPVGYGGVEEQGPINFLNNVLRLVFVVAGIYALLNLVLAGFQYMSAGEDPKALEKAWNKIWQSLLGLLILVASFVLAAIFGYLLFGDPQAILNPKLYLPGE